MTAHPETVSDRPPMTDWRDAAIAELIDHNLAIRCQLACLRPELGTTPGPDLVRAATLFSPPGAMP